MSSPQDSIKWEATEYTEDLLLGKPEARRADERAAGGDDGVVAEGCSGVVPEQEVQRQEAADPGVREAAHEGCGGECSLRRIRQ